MCIGDGGGGGMGTVHGVEEGGRRGGGEKGRSRAKQQGGGGGVVVFTWSERQNAAQAKAGEETEVFDGGIRTAVQTCVGGGGSCDADVQKMRTEAIERRCQHCSPNHTPLKPCSTVAKRKGGMTGTASGMIPQIC